jgi:hypothetical protein
MRNADEILVFKSQEERGIWFCMGGNTRKYRNIYRDWEQISIQITKYFA